MSREILNFYVNLNNMNTKENLEKYMLFTLSPVIGGFKPSSTITLSIEKGEDKIWNEIKEKFLNISNLKELILRENNKSKIILIYSEDKLLNFLLEKDNYIFLNNLGYKFNLGLKHILENLKDRYEESHCPHELGIFLGIPIEDVIDFMNCSNKKCLLCGYWKVFNDCNKAKETFLTYDRSKITMIEAINFSDEINIILDVFSNKISA